MSADLVTLENGKVVQLPPPQHEGAIALWQRASRLPGWLPTGVNPYQFMVAVTAEANKKELANCTPASVVTSAFNAAVLGLLPGSVLGHAYFVPFKKTSQLIVGYRGLLELAYGGGFLRDVQCELVLRGETYRRWNTIDGPQLEHEIPIDRDEKWENVQAAYCIWHSQAGGRGVFVVPRTVLGKLKQRGNVWASDPLAMCLKTPLRRAAKSWKLTQRMGAAVTLDDLAEAGKPQPALAGDVDEPEKKPSLDSFGVGSEPPETLKADNAADREADYAQAIEEYRETVGNAETLKAVDEAEIHAKNNAVLTDEAKNHVAAWCESQRLVIRERNQKKG